MKVIWLSCKVLSGVLCFILMFPRADSSQIYDGVQGSSEELNSYQNPLYGRVIAAEAARATSTDAFDELLRKNSQRAILAWDLLAEKFLSNIHYNSEVSGVEENGEETSLEPRKLNRRSVSSSETKDEPVQSERVPDSGFPELTPNSKDKLTPDSRAEPSSVSSENHENQHYQRPAGRLSNKPDVPSPNQAERDFSRPSFELSLKGQMGEAKRHRTLQDKELFEDTSDSQRRGPLGNLRFGLPGQPVRRMLGFLLDRLSRSWPIVDADQSEARLPRRLFDQERNTLSSENSEFGRVGIHKAVKLGPLSVSVDVGRPRYPSNFEE